MNQVQTRSLRLRGCPRCGGDLYLDALETARGEPPVYACLQCGRRAVAVASETAATGDHIPATLAKVVGQATYDGLDSAAA